MLVDWLAFDQYYELTVLSGIGLVLIGVIMLQKSAREVTVDKKLMRSTFDYAWLSSLYSGRC